MQQQLALIEYLRETLVPLNDTENRAAKIEEAEVAIIIQEKKRKQDKTRQNFTNDNILRSMVFYAWSVRKGSDIFNEEEFKIATMNFSKGKAQEPVANASSKNTTSGISAEVDYYVWGRIRSNLMRKLKAVIRSVILTVRKDMKNSANLLRDESEVPEKKRKVKNIVVNDHESASEHDSDEGDDSEPSAKADKRNISSGQNEQDKENINPQSGVGGNKRSFAEHTSSSQSHKGDQSTKRSKGLKKYPLDSEEEGDEEDDEDKTRLETESTSKSKMREEYDNCKLYNQV